MDNVQKHNICASFVDRVVGIAIGYGLDDRVVVVRVLVRTRIFSSPQCPDRLWGPPSLLSNEHWWIFPRGCNISGVKLTTHLQLVPRSRECGSIHPLPRTPSWRSTWLIEHRDNFTFTFISWRVSVISSDFLWWNENCFVDLSRDGRGLHSSLF
jgi:hypothetical protein